MQLKPSSVIVAQTDAFTLTPGNSLWVKAGVRLLSSQETGVFAQNGGAYRMRIDGQVLGDNGIEIDDSGFQQSHRIIIGQTGRVTSFDEFAVAVDGKALSFINNGVLEGNSGVYFYSTQASSSATFVNTGSILAGYFGFDVGGIGTRVLINSGKVISYGLGVAYRGGPGTADRVVNSGLMVGDINLSGGNDVYDGRGGRLIGEVYADAGDDTFFAGASAETFYGGDGFDTVIFSGRTGVRLALDGSLANTGLAKRDTYSGIEEFIGTLAADVMVGDATANFFVGGAGNDLLNGGGGGDALDGGAGNDRLIGGLGNDNLQGNTGNDNLNGGDGDDLLSGGAGADTLTGGAGADYFELRGPAAGADRITDFSLADDLVRIHRPSFGLTGAPAGNWFLASTTNRATEAANRFILRTSDDTLWWDADGTGSRAPVLLATFANGAEVTAGNFQFSLT